MDFDENYVNEAFTIFSNIFLRIYCHVNIKEIYIHNYGIITIPLPYSIIKSTPK
jgi:hypothetical protein